MEQHTVFTEEEVRAFAPEAKVALLATVDPEGLPHVTLITSLMAKGEREVIWGQFSEGRSKTNVRANPKTGWLVLTPDRRLWRGTAVYRDSATSGEDYDAFNEKPMFRYNAYFGIHTAHTMDLVGHTGRESLPLPKILAAAARTRLARGAVGMRRAAPVLKPWAHRFFNKPTTLAFACFVREDGFPWIVPLLPCQAADATRLAFSPAGWRGELSAVSPGRTMAVFALSLAMESVLVRGRFSGFGTVRRMPLGCLDIDWVYNSMPPKPGVIHPMPPLTPVRDFGMGDVDV